MGMNNEQLYNLSQRIIGNSDGAKYAQAYNLSYADVYDFLSVKQTLKKWQIDLGLPHKEMDIPWDQPVPDDRIMDVLEYCDNDVLSLEALFEARQPDFIARQILADLSGLTVNDTTRMHAGKIIFGNDRNPQESFVYTDLSKLFKGYVFDEFAKVDKSTYRGEVVGEGGYVYAEPGMYENVALLDVASMHPTSIEQLNLFGDEYTKKFCGIKNARLALKHADEAKKKEEAESFEKHIEEVRGVLDGILEKYLDDEGNFGPLSDALKLVINSIYGYTSAKFPNAFRDPRNKDNIVAKRGALFMIDLKHAVQEQGFTVAHIKTDSIKIPNATPEIIEFVKEFGKKYGYEFEHEATYDKFCLVNDAVFIAYVGWNAKNKPSHWKAVGAQFQHPYIFKTLFTHEPISFEDICETKAVQSPSAIYLDFDSNAATPNDRYSGMHFVGKTGRFIPVTSGGGALVRVKDDKPYAVTGTKGYFWLESEMVKILHHNNEVAFFDYDLACGQYLDGTYFERLITEAKNTIEKFGDFSEFVKV